MLPTPATSHVNYDHIYEPAEDSYLLLDTLSAKHESTFLANRFATPSPVPLIMEVGTGSGIVLAFATANAKQIFGRSDVLSIGSDVNALACVATTKTVQLAIADSVDNGHVAGLFGSALNADLTAPLRPQSVDVLIFNPPYVPTEALPPATDDAALAKLAERDRFERDSHLLALSYAGGVDGMETTNRLLDQLPEILSRRGVAHVLLCKQNRPEAVLKSVRSWPGEWSAEIVGSSGKKAGWEQLCVVRIWRP